MSRALTAHNAAAVAEPVTRPRWLARLGSLRLSSRGEVAYGGHTWLACTMRQPAIDGAGRATLRIYEDDLTALDLESLLRAEAAPAAEVLMLFGDGAAPADAADTAFEGVVSGADVARGWVNVRLAPPEDRFSPPLRFEAPAFGHLPADDLLLQTPNGAQAAEPAPAEPAPPAAAPRAAGSLPDWVAPVTPAGALNAQLPRAPGNLLAKGRPIPIVYGEAQCSPLIFAASWSAGTWTVGCAWCLGEVESVAVLLDGEAPAAGGTQTHHLGTTAQAADATLAAAIAGYADTLVLTHPGGRIGVAYSVLTWSDADYPSFPAITATVRGLKTNAGAWSANPGHAARHFVEHPVVGLDDEAAAAGFAALAAACDERVGAGAEAEPRRAIGLVIDRPLPARQWLQILAAYAGGWITRDGGRWHAQADRPPSGGRVSAFSAAADSPDILWFAAAAGQPVFRNSSGSLRYVASDTMPALPAGLVAGGGDTVRLGRIITHDPAGARPPLFEVGLTAGPRWDSTTEALVGEDRLAICVRVEAATDPPATAAAALPLAGLDDPYIVRAWTAANRAVATLLWGLPSAGGISYGAVTVAAAVVRAAALDAALTVPGTAAQLDGGDWVAGSFGTRFADRAAAPTVVEVEYTDSGPAVWSTQVASAELPGVAAGTLPRRTSRVRLPGVTRHSQAKREAEERLAKLRRAAVQHRFRGHADLDALTVGDPISVQRRGVLSTCRVLSRRRLESGHVEITAAEYDAEDYDDSVVRRPAEDAPAKLGGGARAYAEVTVYQLIDVGAALPAAPAGGSFRFSTGALTPPPGWSAGFPAGRAAHQVALASAATANALRGDLWLAAAGDWSAPFPAARDGDVNIAYRRSASQPDTPAASRGVPAGWTDVVDDVPAGDDPIWASVGHRPAPEANYRWQAAVRFEGEDGKAGRPGVASQFTANVRVTTRAPAAATEYALVYGAVRRGMLEGWAVDNLLTHIELGGADAGDRLRYFPTVRVGDVLVGLDAAEDPDEWVSWRITSVAVNGATAKFGVEHLATDAINGAFWAAADSIEFGFSRPPTATSPAAVPSLWRVGAAYEADDPVLHTSAGAMGAYSAISPHTSAAANAPATSGGEALWRAWSAVGETTDRDAVYRRAANQPATPAGGEAAESHTPAGWSRARQAPTATEGEWRSQRTRTYRGGAFASATAWEAPARITGATGAITTDYDDVYRLGGAAPGTPAGGETTEAHAPAGWSRAVLAPTAAQDVYRATRTRRFRGGSFTAATAWGAPTLLAMRTAAVRRLQLTYDDVRPTLDGDASVDAQGEYAVLDAASATGVRENPTFDQLRAADGVALHIRDAGGVNRQAALRTVGPGDTIELRKGGRWAKWIVHTAFDSNNGIRRQIFFDAAAFSHSGASSAAWGDGACTVTVTATTKQVVTASLTGGVKTGRDLYWVGGSLPALPAAWSEGNVAATVSYLRVSSAGAAQLNTAVSPSTARELTAAWETGAVIRLWTATGRVRIAGPNAAGATAASTDEPYRWTPANAAAVAAFFAAAAASGVAAQLSIEA